MVDAPVRIWIIEKYGRSWGRLEGAHFVDMFWVGYRVIDLTETEEDRRMLYSAPFWLDGPLPTFRHVPTGIVCDTAFAGSGVLPTAETPLVVMRALYPPDRKAHWLQRWKNWVMRRT